MFNSYSKEGKRNEYQTKSKVSQLYGYDNLNRNILTINKEKALIVKRIFNMYIDGYSTIDIANILNKEKITPPIETGKLWYPVVFFYSMLFLDK